MTDRARQKAATIYAVAERAGVSTATVSRVLAGSEKVAPATRDAVMEAASGLHYVPAGAARALAGRRTRALGLVLPHVDGPYYAELLVGFETAASALGLSVVIVQAHPGIDARRALMTLAGQVDGIAFMARSAASRELVEETAERRPVVTAARARQEGLESFFVENQEPARALTEHLVRSGRRRLAFVGRPEHGSDVGSRYRGFSTALRAAGLTESARYDVDLVEARGTEVAERLLAERDSAGELPCDALVCANDELALAVMHRLAHAGVRAGTDLAVTGWDESLAARYVTPGLTSVAQPARRLAAMAAERLAQLVDGADPVAAPITLPASIRHRASCGCALPDPQL